MLGFYVCLECGTTHDDWFHGDRLLVCNKCMSKNSVRYKTQTKSFVVSGIEMVSWSFNPDLYDIIRKKIDFNPFDMIQVKRECVRPPDLFIEISKNIDEYIKFAYHGFEDPQIIYDRYLLKVQGKNF